LAKLYKILSLTAAPEPVYGGGGGGGGDAPGEISSTSNWTWAPRIVDPGGTVFASTGVHEFNMQQADHSACGN
jgi:hypothetical protein